MLKWTKVLSILFGVALTIAGLVASGYHMRAENSKQSNEAGVKILQPWARATPGGATVGAAYMSITTMASEGDRVIAASSPLAGRVEIHSHINDGGVMRMRQVEGLTIVPGKPSALAPGGDHIMLFDLKKPLKSGDVLPLTLTFENAGSVSVEATIKPIGTRSPNQGTDHGATVEKEGADRGSPSGHEGHHSGH